MCFLYVISETVTDDNYVEDYGRQTFHSYWKKEHWVEKLNGNGRPMIQTENVPCCWVCWHVQRAGTEVVHGMGTMFQVLLTATKR